MTASLSRPAHDRSSSRRRGSVMVLALACLAVASAIALSMLRAATTSHRSLRAERHLRQVECLLAAATATAHVRLATGGPDAADEVILLEPDALTGVGSARVTLGRDADANSPAIRVVVEYPLEGPVTIRRSRTVSHPSVAATTPEEPRP
ncbi:MAG: hypothetical protein ACR2IT_08300 [Pirellulales bacterium]